MIVGCPDKPDSRACCASIIEALAWTAGVCVEACQCCDAVSDTAGSTCCSDTLAAVVAEMQKHLAMLNSVKGTP